MCGIKHEGSVAVLWWYFGSCFVAATTACVCCNSHMLTSRNAVSSLHRDADSVSRQSLLNDNANHGEEGVDMMQADDGAMANR